MINLDDDWGTGFGKGAKQYVAAAALVRRWSGGLTRLAVLR